MSEPASTAKQILNSRGLERRLKRHFLKQTHTIVISTTRGFEQLLAIELKELLQPEKEIEIEPGICRISARLDALYKANLYSRIASRVFLEIDSFLVKSYPELFSRTRRIDWYYYLGLSGEADIEVNVKSSRLHHEKNIASTVQQAIKACYDRFTIDHKKNHNESSRAKLHINMYQDNCTIRLNTSAEPLYKRGFRETKAVAPLRENIVAGLLFKVFMQYKTNLLVDAFAGSGTFTLETMLCNRQAPLHIFRKVALMSLPFFRKETLNQIEREMQQMSKEASVVIKNLPQKSVLIEYNRQAIETLRQNMNTLKNHIKDKASGQDLLVTEVIQADFFKESTLNKIEKNNHILVTANPPWGERLSNKNTSMAIYENLGKTLKSSFKGAAFLIIVPTAQHREALDLEAQITDSIRFRSGGIYVDAISGVI